MRKVVLLVDFLQSVFGGTERQMFELCRNIDRGEFELIVGCLSKWDGFLQEIEEYGIKTIRLKVDRIYGMDGLRQGLWFFKFLKKEKPDILMTHHFASDIWGTILGRMARVPVIISNRRDSGFWRERRHVLAYRLLQGWVDKIVVVSQAVKDVVLEEEMVKNGKIEVIHNGIDMQRFNRIADVEETRQELQVPPKAKLVGCVGNIRPVKGHKSLIEAAKIVFQELPDTHFVLVGGGKWRKDLMKTCKHLGLASNIHFPGMRQDVPELLDCMDICVLPSLSEGFSNTLLEYMAAGKPIVATRVGGNPEVIIHEKNGLLANKEDPNDLAENILFLLSDEEAAERMGVQARKDVENQFALERMVERYQVLFKDLTRGGHEDDVS